MGQAVALQFALAALSIATMVALPGCTLNDCPASGQTKCGSSTELATCEPTESNSPLGSDSLQWHSTSCGAGNHCVQAEGQTFCSPVSAPIAECARDGYSCWQNAVIGCTGGFPTGGVVCGGSACMVNDDRSCGYCLPPDTVAIPDPVCAARATYTCTGNALTCNTTCVDNAVYNCNCGLRLSKKTDCGGVCVTVLGTSACALSDTPDPLCMDPDIAHGSSFPPPSESGEGWSQYCEQGELVECLGEFQVQRTPCQECLWGTCSIFGDAGPDAQGD